MDISDVSGYNYQLERGSNATTYSLFQDLNPNTTDTNWQIMTLASSTFAYYDNDHKLKIRKIGNVVYIRGAVKPTVEISSSAVIAIIPTGYRPSEQSVFVCQGGGMNRWDLRIENNGRMTIERYGTTTASAIPVDAWLPICISYSI